MEYSQNTIWLMEWCDRMVKKYGQPETGVDWCRKLAYFTDEAGNDSPSDNAITIAKTWEEELCFFCHEPDPDYKAAWLNSEWVHKDCDREAQQDEERRQINKIEAQ